MTERRVMEAILGLGAGYTVVMIAHRLSTVSQCDRIVELKAGRIQAQGCYEELLRISPSFRQLSKASQV